MVWLTSFLLQGNKELSTSVLLFLSPYDTIPKPADVYVCNEQRKAKVRNNSPTDRVATTNAETNVSHSVPTDMDAMWRTCMAFDGFSTTTLAPSAAMMLFHLHGFGQLLLHQLHWCCSCSTCMAFASFTTTLTASAAMLLLFHLHGVWQPLCDDTDRISCDVAAVPRQDACVNCTVIEPKFLRSRPKQRVWLTYPVLLEVSDVIRMQCTRRRRGKKTSE